MSIHEQPGYGHLLLLFDGDRNSRRENQLIWIFFLMFHRVSWITGGFRQMSEPSTVHTKPVGGPIALPERGLTARPGSQMGKLEFYETKTAIHVQSSLKNVGFMDLVKGNIWWLQKRLLFFKFGDVGELWNVQLEGFCFSKPLMFSSSQGGAECSEIRTKKLAE